MGLSTSNSQATPTEEKHRQSPPWDSEEEVNGIENVTEYSLDDFVTEDATPKQNGTDISGTDGQCDNNVEYFPRILKLESESDFPKHDCA